MDLILHRSPLRLFRQQDGSETEIDLQKVALPSLLTSDLARLRITGTIPALPDLRLTNFVESVMHDIVADGVDFTACDFKDSFIRNAAFSSCDFSDGTLATSFFLESVFRGCRFDNHAVYDCDFQKVQFERCDLRNLLVKSSKFTDCTFRDCTTSNKIAEMSVFRDSRFVDTSIQIDTIINNFGLSSRSLERSPIRSARTRQDFRLLNAADLENELSSRHLTPLEKLRLDYFLDPDLTRGSINLDEALNITSWTKIYKNPTSFVELLDRFSEFLVDLWDSQLITAHTILRFHQVTSSLTETVTHNETGHVLHRAAQAVSGTHMMLSRIAEEYFDALDSLRSVQGNTLRLLVDGPEDADYFRRELEPWLSPEGIVIKALGPRNSPLILELFAEATTTFLPLLAAFLATRTKLEIKRLRLTVPSLAGLKTLGVAPLLRSRENAVPPEDHLPLSVFSARAGLVTQPSPAYELRLLSLFPGSILVDFRLDISTALAGKLRKVILDLLSDSTGKGAQ